MSKKLIAVASAAALALSALVAVAPAQALPFDDTATATGNSILVTGTVARGDGKGTISLPYLVPVPESGLATTATMLRIAISSDVKSRAFTVTSTSGIKLLDAVADATNKYTAASGSASLSLTTNASGAADFQAFPTSTTRGVITVTLDGDVTQIYVTGTAGAAWNVTSVVFPAIEEKKTGVVTAVVTDAFGNAVTSATLTATPVGAGVSSSAVTMTYSTTTKRFEGTIPAGTTTGQIAVGLNLTAGVTETDDTKAAFGAAKLTAFGLITVGAAADVTALKAEITTLKAAVATLTADYNALAKKWNKGKKKSKRVALK
jgi:hypothetical protein